MTKFLYRLFEYFRSIFMPWKWNARIKCHGSISCCQFIDWPNDNHPTGVSDD